MSDSFTLEIRRGKDCGLVVLNEKQLLQFYAEMKKSIEAATDAMGLDLSEWIKVLPGPDGGPVNMRKMLAQYVHAFTSIALMVRPFLPPEQVEAIDNLFKY